MSGKLFQQTEDLARAQGFEFVAATTADRLQAREEVRAMCSADMCHAYGKSWSCPPAIGPIEEFQERFGSFDDVVVVETVMELEDEFDFETMQEAEQVHKKRLEELVAKMREIADDFLPLGVGTCKMCDPCTYPDDPCRYPEKMIVSMEAAGLVVSDVCNAASIPYNHGSDHICYVSCVLV